MPTWVGIVSDGAQLAEGLVHYLPLSGLMVLLVLL